MEQPAKDEPKKSRLICLTCGNQYFKLQYYRDNAGAAICGSCGWDAIFGMRYSDWPPPTSRLGCPEACDGDGIFILEVDDKRLSATCAGGHYSGQIEGGAIANLINRKENFQ